MKSLMQYIKENKKEVFCFWAKIMFIVLLSIVTTTIFIYVQYSQEHTKTFMVEQIKVASMLMFFIYLFPFFGFKKTAHFVFQYRWFVAGGILLFLVLGKYHGDSITMYDRYIQTGSGSEFVEPLFGVGRGIRSDDWVVTTPAIISNEYCENPYSETNEILRGTDTNNAIWFANQSSIFSVGASVFTILFGKVDVEYAFSFYWFLCFSSTIELGMLITKKDKFLSVLGAALITFSSWFLWWRFPMVLTYAQMAVVLAYYFMKDTRKIYKAVYILLFSIFFSNFVCFLYPAWQVPLGYVALVFAIWLIHDNWKDIKQWKSEWLFIVFAVILAGVLIGYYLYSVKDYISAITQTVYPGERRDYGGMAIGRMFNGFVSPLFGLINLNNPTMVSIVSSFYPIPLFLLLCRVIKEKKKDVLIYGLMILSVIFTLYCTTGLPSVFCDLILLSRSTTSKVVEILSVLQVYILLIYLKEYKEKLNMNKSAAWVLGIGYALVCIIFCNAQLPDYIPGLYMIFMAIVFAGVIFVLLTKQKKVVVQAIFSVIIIITFVQGIYVRPVAKGLDAIYSKPIAKKIQEICDMNKEAKWLAVGDNIMVSGFLVACGAPTVNSVNLYPNMELWTKLDPEGEYEEVYNRYAHIYLELTEEETSFELVKSDVMKIYLNYNDLETVGVEYIMSTESLEEKSYGEIALDRVYKKNKSFIYKVKYN